MNISRVLAEKRRLVIPLVLAIIANALLYAVVVFPSAGAFLESGCLATIDCVISDIDMPATDGFDLLLAVHAIRPALPVILITGHPEMLDRLRYARANHHALLTKPFDGPALLAAVGDAVGTPD